MNFLFNNNAEITESYINERCNVTIAKNVNEEDFNSVCNTLCGEGYELKEKNIKPFHKHFGYLKGDTGVFVNYFANINEITVTIEMECRYFSYADSVGKKVVTPQITQLHLEDFGMSYVIRLSDGRFVIIDGGWDLTPDAERLFEVLKKGSVSEKPVIAAWILSHMHLDHYRCFNRFTELHKDDVILEKVMFNFPFKNIYYFEEGKNFRNAEIKEEYSYENTSDKIHVAKFIENIKLYSAEIYTPHTGQVYQIGDAVFECLSCVDDTYHFSVDDNASSLVFKMTLAGQNVFWTADSNIADSAFVGKYGEYLKSDILQIPHHGFFSGEVNEHKRFYDYVDAEVGLLPVSGYNAYVVMDTYLDASAYLFEYVSLKQIIDGDETVTINLPYHAPACALEEYKNKFNDGRKAAGSKVWIFSGLDSSADEDFVFDILNATVNELKISVEMFFEDGGQRTTGTEIVVPRYSLKNCNLKDGSSVNLNKCHFNWESVNVRKIPANTTFAVRFISNKGFVVTHKKHKPAYNS